MGTLTKDDAQSIASEVHGIRPEWGEAGIMAALAKVQSRDSESVHIAALQAARNRSDQRTPAIIAMDGPHWNGTPYGKSKATTTPDRLEADRCGVCSRHRFEHSAVESKVAPERRHEWERDTGEQRTVNVRALLAEALQHRVAA